MGEISFSEIQKSLRKNEYCVIDTKTDLVIVYDRTANTQHGEERIKRLYKVVGKDRFEEFDVDAGIAELADKLSEKVELQEILKEVLRSSQPSDIIKALEALKEPTTEIVKEPGCIAFNFKNEKGRSIAYFAVRSA